MIEYRIIIKTTENLSTEEVNAVIALKQQHWPYNDAQQRRWFDENIRDNDHHIMLIGEGKLLAYLDVINVDVKVNESGYKMLGVGNVCVDHGNEHRGLGNLIMAVANAFIKQSRRSGILLCKDQLVGFYKAAGWNVLQSKESTIGETSFDNQVMIFNSNILPFPREVETLHLSRCF